MSIQATYFDGETARDRFVTVRHVGNAIEFIGEDTPLTSWPISGIHPIDPPSAGQPFRITHQSKPGARLVLRDHAFINALVAANRHLKGGYGFRHWGAVLGWTAGGLAALAVAGYIAFSVLPDKFAYVLPDTWRNRAAQDVVKAVVGSARRCQNPAGQEAIAAMISALAEGRPDLPPISVEVYDMKILNAFAVPGGRIILMRELIEQASNPNEVTGVLAHEIGHVAHRDPEAQMVRLAGLSVLSSIFSGGGNGDWISSIAGLTALLTYSRDAERKADAYARETMLAARIDPTGLKTFFEKIKKTEEGDKKDNADGNSKSALDKIGSILSTHPGTEDRIKEIQPLPAGITPVQVMTEQQWQALKRICN